MYLLHSCSSRTLSTIARMDPIPSVSPSAILLLLTGSFLPLGLQDPFKNYTYCSSTYIVPISHRYGRYPYQVYYIPAICRYWWGTAIPSTPIKGCTNACLLQRVYHIFAYLKKHHNAELVFDPTDPVIDMSLFERKDWTTSEMSQCLKEVLPENMPRPRGLGFIMRAFVDADHATDSITRKSRTGFLVYLNGAPIYWLSKKQTSVETSSFGSEFTAMKACTEYIRGLRYKLRM